MVPGFITRSPDEISLYHSRRFRLFSACAKMRESGPPLRLAMHELSLARGLIRAVERNLDSDQCRVLRIDLRVGSAAGIVVDSLRLAFSLVSSGTRADGAALSIETVPATCRCRKCGSVFKFTGMIGECSGCGSLGGELLSGDEMILRSIEVADV